MISDVEPPTILCLTPQIFYADRGLLTASSVVWEEPTAYDTVDNNPVIVQTKGVDQGSTLSEGSTYVSYSATDANGNKSPECSIELRVERKSFLFTLYLTGLFVALILSLRYSRLSQIRCKNVIQVLYEYPVSIKTKTSVMCNDRIQDKHIVFKRHKYIIVHCVAMITV